MNDLIAALFVETNGCYFGLPNVEPWDATRDARKYDGPHRVVAHPPCERWGRYWNGGPSAKVKREKGDDAGCFAAALVSVRKFGGVLEHPEASSAWAKFELNRPPHSGGWAAIDRAEPDYPPPDSATCFSDWRHPTDVHQTPSPYPPPIQGPVDLDRRGRMKTYKPHPAAKLLPKMSNEQIDELAADIKANGQKHAVVITKDDLLLDGRHRQEACIRAGVKLKVEMWPGEFEGESPTSYVLSVNKTRRHLTPSQAAMVAADALPLLEKEARARLKASGGDRRSASAPVRSPVAPTKKGKAATFAAKSMGVSTRIVEQAKAVSASAPAAELKKIRDGEKTIKQVMRETKLTEQRAQVKAYVPPAGEFAVISVDFSWEYDDELDGEGARGGLGYPTMTIAEICAFPIPAAKDCALFCWVTNSHLIDPNAYAVVARSLFDRYGFRPKQIRTWRKVTNDGEKERIGGGRAWRNNTEHLVRFERGRPVYNAVTQATCFDAPRGEPSEKPQKAYDDIEALCASTSRLEIFARKERAGWVTSGSEMAKDGSATIARDPSLARKRKLVIEDTEAA